MVRKGQSIAEIGPVLLDAPLDGVLRGLTHDGVPVTLGTKVIEVDPRGRAGEVRGIASDPDGSLRGSSLQSENGNVGRTDPAPNSPNSPDPGPRWPGPDPSP